MGKNQAKAAYPGQFNEKTFTREAINKRLVEHGCEYKRLPLDMVKAIGVAQNIADLRHERVYVSNLDGVNYLITQGQHTAFHKGHPSAPDSHLVKPSWEHKVQS